MCREFGTTFLRGGRRRIGIGDCLVVRDCCAEAAPASGGGWRGGGEGGLAWLGVMVGRRPRPRRGGGGAGVGNGVVNEASEVRE